MEPEGANPAPVPIDEDALKGISGGQMMNSTETVSYTHLIWSPTETVPSFGTQ